MKKIVFSNYDDIKNPYYSGGGAIAIHEIATRLANFYEVTVITGNYPQASNKRVKKVNYKRIGISFGGPKIGQLVFQFLLPFAAQSMKFDLWIENLTPPFSTSLLPVFYRKKVIALVHMLPGEDMQRKYKLPFKKIEKVSLKNYKKFIVTQDSIKNIIKKSVKKSSVIVIPNGVNQSARHNRKKKHVLFLGRIEVDQKGIDLLLKSYIKVSKETDVKLLIVGSGENKQVKILKKLIKKFALGKNVTMIGRIDGAIKSRLIEEAFCTVVPSRYETFSMSALESLALGTQVVCFDIEGLKWLPINLSDKIPAFDTDRMSEEILNKIKKTTPNKFKKDSYIFTKNLSWDNLATQYKKVLN